MRKVIRQFDRAIKNLYNLDSTHRAENFLIEPNSPRARVPAANVGDTQGAVIVKFTSREADNVDLGIILGNAIKRGLAEVESLDPKLWLQRQAHALSVAAEEISHFHYLVYHFEIEKKVTQLELELQGEIDKFLLLFYTVHSAEAPAGSEALNVFQALFEQLFYQFSWAENLSAEQKDRYSQANAQAKTFIKNFGEAFLKKKSQAECLEYLRRFYRLTQSEKLGFISRLP